MAADEIDCIRKSGQQANGDGEAVEGTPCFYNWYFFSQWNEIL